MQLRKILILVFNFPLLLLAQGVGINSSGVAPNASAILDVSSTDKGLLIPRVALTGTTDATTIANGNVTSLLVYNTATVSGVTPGYYYWSGAVWQTLGGDADADVTNEIQDLQLSGNDLTITNNGSATTIDLSAYLDNTDNQNIDSVALNGTNLTVYIEGGNAATIDLSALQDGVNDADSDPSNEIELPTGGANGQILSTDGSGNYTWVNDAGGTDNQDLTLTGNTLSLTNDATTVDLSSYLDNTDAQTLSLSGNTLSISNGNNVNLSSIKDHDWYEVGGASQPDNINDNIYTQGNVGIGDVNPGEKLSVKGNIRVGGNSTGPNYIAFHGTTLDGPSSYSHGYIGERIYGGSESSELFIFKGNDAATVSGPDRIRLASADILFDTYSTALSGTFSSVASSTQLTNRMIIKDNGKVGIGTPNPIRKLDIHQDATNGILGHIALTGRNTTSSNPNLTQWTIYNMAEYGGQDGLSFWEYYDADNDGDFCDGDGGACGSRMIIAKGGNVGIGISTPSEKLEVNGRVKIGSYTLPSTDGSTGQVLTTNGSGNVSWSNPSSGGGCKNLIITKSASTQTVTYTHGLGVIPSSIKLDAADSNNSSSKTSFGSWDGTNNVCVSRESGYTYTSNTYAAQVRNFPGEGMFARITNVTATTFDIQYTYISGTTIGNMIIHALICK